MDGGELRADGTRSQTLLAWIIEYVWAHRVIHDIHQVVDPSRWPDIDSQPLSLDHAWRLRVASAQAYSFVKNRDVEHFERVMAFLDSTYRLLPSLVAPIKHMKLMFGLKTMVIMWMFRAGRGMVDIVCKIGKFFPSKLPQYQDQCVVFLELKGDEILQNQHDMFLMRKNHVDFKTWAQALAMDKEKLNDYMKEHVDEQYGEGYARKVEDRLLHYLHRLETVLPGDTHVDQILKKSSPVTEEEKLLLEIVGCDSIAIATALKRLLHCDAASCPQARIHQESPENRETQIESAQISPSKALLKPGGGKGKVFRGGQEASKDGPDVGGQRVKEGGDVAEEEDESSELAPSPHFCSKHQRWVRSILQQCPDECSEELRLQASLPSSPLLFLSSSSTSSSQDLTPSDLVPCPASQSVAQLPTSEQSSSEDGRRSGSASDASRVEPVPQPSPDRLPTLRCPVVRLVDIAAKGGPPVKPQQPDDVTATSAPQVPALLYGPPSGNKGSIFHQPGSAGPSCSSCRPRTFQRRTRVDARRPQASDGFSQMPLGFGVGGGSSPSSAEVSEQAASQESSTSAPPALAPGVSSGSSLLQPYVSISRLSSRECYTVTEGRCSAGTVGGGNLEETREEEDEHTDSSFDPNSLYSSQSSSSDGDDSDCDPDYEAPVSKTRLLLEREAEASGKAHHE